MPGTVVLTKITGFRGGADTVRAGVVRSAVTVVTRGECSLSSKAAEHAPSPSRRRLAPRGFFLAFLARLRVRSAGELLDQSVSIAVRNVVPLGTIAVIQLVASHLAAQALSTFVVARFVHLPHVGSMRDLWLGQDIRIAVDFVYATIAFACEAVAIMASALVIEEVLCGTRPNVREAFAEALDEWRPALVALAAYVGLFAVATLIRIAVLPAFFAHQLWATALGVMLVAIWTLGTIVIVPAMYVAWAHIALRASSDDDSFFLTARYLLKPSLTTVLAVVAVLALDNAPDVLLQAALHVHLPGAVMLARAMYYSVLFSKALLLNVFIVLFYLDLCARHGGIDLAQEVGVAGESADSG
jgi:hypothetical protein